MAYTNDPNKLKHRVFYHGSAINEITAGSHIFETAFAMPSVLPGGQPAPYAIEGPLYFDAAGNIFGLSVSGGSYKDGSCYEISADRQSVSLVASFNGADGLVPVSGLIASGDGDLFGSTVSGGIGWPSYPPAFSGNGTLFKIAATSKAMAPIAFFNGDNGTNPIGKLLLDSSGNIFGATVRGGTNNEGTVYELPAGSNTPITLATFDNSDALPSGGLISDARGNLYGATAGFYGPGGSGNTALGDGTIYEIDAQTHQLSTLATFNGDNGADPIYELYMDAQGNLFGITNSGGAHGLGTIFEINGETDELRTIYSFSGLDGAYPDSSLIPDAQGNLYGVTYKGGAFDEGTIFELMLPEPRIALWGIVCIMCLRTKRKRLADRRTKADGI